MMIVVSVVILNQQWLLTSASILIAVVGMCFYLGMQIKLLMGVIIPQFALLFIVLTYKTYFIEKKYKSEFL